MFAILLGLVSLGCCECWLDEYFNVTNNEIVKNEAVTLLQNCSESASKWEEAVRLRKIDDGLCSENKLIEKCLPKRNNQSVVFEYIKHLLEDSKWLCHDSFNEALTQRINELLKNSTNISNGIPKEECGGCGSFCRFTAIANCVFATIFGVILLTDIIWFNAIKKKRRLETTDVRANHVCVSGVDTVEYPLA